MEDRHAFNENEGTMGGYKEVQLEVTGMRFMEH
jgi:hypothetical protein